MPRIPVRTEPYSSPSRQHRHFKNKRDQVLRALGKSAYINGSQFAIMWVAASGQTETYASEAFQGRLEDWFENSGIKQEGKRLVLERKARMSVSATSSSGKSRLLEDDGGDDAASQLSDDDSECAAEDDESVLENGGGGTSALSKANTPLLGYGNDVFASRDSAPPIAPISTAHANAVLASTSAAASTSDGVASSSTSLNRPARKLLQPLDISSANLAFAQHSLLLPASAGDGNFLRAPLSAPLPNQRKPPPPMRAPLARTNSNSDANLTQVTLSDKAARTAFFELRFGQMQQGMCKTVAKAWIKIIEPKKQTRCPYNKGEEGKPDWWPEGVRHKEPDHLMKPERHSLLLTILRSPKIKVSRLQLATAEVVAMIRADKVNLLMDVYRIAREEERLRESSKDLVDRPITVGVSTLQGWQRGGLNGEKGGLSEEGRRATMGDDVPESHEKRTGTGTSAQLAAGSSGPLAQTRKRENSQALPRHTFNSASFVAPAEKRQRLSIVKVETPETMASNNLNDLRRCSSTPSGRAPHSQLQPHLHTEGGVGPSKLRRQASSQDVNTSAMAATSHDAGHRAVSRQQQQQQQQYQFQQAAHAQTFATPPQIQLRLSELDGRYPIPMQQQQQQQSFQMNASPLPGSMSAPQPATAQLYPHQHEPQHRQQQQYLPQHTSSVDNSPAIGYSYELDGQTFLGTFDASRPQQHNVQQIEAASGGSLGLQGLGVGTLQHAMMWGGSTLETGSVQQPWTASPAPQMHSHQQGQPAQQQEDQISLLRAHLAEAGSSGRATASPSTLAGPHRATFVHSSEGGDDSMGDLSLDMDRSFASTSSHRSGPATPPSAISRHSNQGITSFIGSAPAPAQGMEKVMLQQRYPSQGHTQGHRHADVQMPFQQLQANHQNGVWAPAGAEAFTGWAMNS